MRGGGVPEAPCLGERAPVVVVVVVEVVEVVVVVVVGTGSCSTGSWSWLVVSCVTSSCRRGEEHEACGVGLLLLCRGVAAVGAHQGR